MMRLSLAAFLAAGMFAFGAPALSMAAPQVPADGLDFAGSKKTVKFNHSTHAKEACETCHHKVDGKENFQKCATAGCHDDLTGKQPPKSLFAVVHSKKELAPCQGRRRRRCQEEGTHGLQGLQVPSCLTVSFHR